jgi:hypothetical protein
MLAVLAQECSNAPAWRPWVLVAILVISVLASVSYGRADGDDTPPIPVVARVAYTAVITAAAVSIFVIGSM